MSSTSKRPPGGRQPLTTAEIAEMAGVSIATVSKVLNNRTDVAAPTRLLVEKVIDKHGHRRRRRPSPATPLIDVLFNTLSGTYAMAVIKGVDRVARQHRMGVVVSGLGGAHTPGPEWLESVLIRRPTGVIAVFCTPTPEQRAQLRIREIPIVAVDPVAEAADTPSVAVTNWNGGVEATRHLVELGHRRIGVIAGPSRLLAARARLDGYRAALDEAGIAPAPELIRSGEFEVWEGEAAPSSCSRSTSRRPRSSRAATRWPPASTGSRAGSASRSRGSSAWSATTTPGRPRCGSIRR